MIIDALPSAPLPTDTPVAFNAKAFALVAALETFVDQANATGVAADADAAAALASQIAAGLSKDAAIAAANFKGAWSRLSGALAIPASVSHLSKVWILTESVANVTSEVPGTSSKWIAVSVNFDSPGPIGGTTPSSGSFTELTLPNLGGLKFYASSSGPYTFAFVGAENYSNLCDAGGAGIRFLNQALSVEYARFNTSGNLYINSASNPIAALGINPPKFGILGVSGSPAAAFVSSSSADTINVLSSPGTSANLAEMFVKNGTSVGNITMTSTATAYNTSSDYRLKSNQAPLQNSGSFIDALAPKTWEWSNGAGEGVGFIAHEVQSVSPSSVTGEKDAVDAHGNPVMQSMEYGSAEFIANIVAELQSLRLRVADLEAN